VRARFEAAGVGGDNVSTKRDTYTFRYSGSPAEFLGIFRNFYGPTINAFAAAERAGKSGELQRELELLFGQQNTSHLADETIIPATFLRVAATKGG
jgi:hypothetical protein